MIESREALEDVLTAGSFAEFVGTVENSWFDAKYQPYDTRTELGKQAFAKDLTAFANADGGFVLIGLRTTPSATHYGDEVIEVRAFEQSLIDPGQYLKIANDWIYPHIVGLDVTWVASADDSTRGVVAIRIPRQHDDLKPFVVVRTITEGKIVESVVGYAERRRDTNEPMKAPDLQRALRAGLHYERALDARLQAIETMLQNLPHRAGPDADDNAQRLDERVRSALQASDFPDDRALVLLAYPAEPNELKSVFTSGGDSIRGKLERPPVLRSGGWDLATQRYTDIIRGELVRIRGFRKLLDLYRDGTFVFACVASDDFLAWTSPNQKLNPIGLVEITYSFCAFYRLVIEDLAASPTSITFHVHMTNLHKDGERTKLGPGSLNNLWQMLPDFIREAPDDSVTLQRSFPASYDPAAAAVELLRELYLWFGLDEEKVPYVTVRDGQRVIDLDALKRG